MNASISGVADAAASAIATATAVVLRLQFA